MFFRVAVLFSVFWRFQANQSESEISTSWWIQVTILPSTLPHRTALAVPRPGPRPRSAPRRGASATNGSGPRRADGNKQQAKMGCGGRHGSLSLRHPNTFWKNILSIISGVQIPSQQMFGCLGYGNWKMGPGFSPLNTCEETSVPEAIFAQWIRVFHAVLELNHAGPSQGISWQSSSHELYQWCHHLGHCPHKFYSSESWSTSFGC